MMKYCAFSSLPLHRLLTAMTGVMLVMIGLTVAAEETPCLAGDAACPNPSPEGPSKVEEPGCGLWLGPSPIKEAEEHGFGLGVFTGRPIPKGAAVEHELLIPLYDSLLHDDHHPPLREYVWDGDNAPEVSLESRRGTFLFMPGLAGIAPCTSKNYNLEITGSGGIVGTPRHNVIPDSGGVHRAASPMAGSFSYRHNVSYTAVRDIVVGEELTVQCSDDDFDGGAYFLSKFKSGDTAFVCVDNNVRIDISEIGGRGLFAKRKLSEGTVVTSTPVIPIDRKEMIMKSNDDDVTSSTNKDSQQQLLLNYCYGHPRSDLLLLPYGPLVNYINHPPKGKTANAVIRWHPVTDKNNNEVLPRRQQHHHPELLEMPAKKVAKTHGKGLMIDIVALRDIAADEEVYIDYGKDWVAAHKAHVEQWETNKGDRRYISAADYNALYDLTTIRTVTEQETNPYPPNLQTVCFWDGDDEEDKEDVYYWSSQDEVDECLRPCTILDRYQHHEGGEVVYKAEMLPIDSTEVPDLCILESPETVADLPRRAIRIIDRPYTADTFMKNAFRHEMGVPEGFYPETWMKKKLRGQAHEDSEDDDGHEFKRKIA